MSKHTRWPWRSSPYQNNDDPTPTGCWEIHALTRKHIATTFSLDNARLIAAAPEMLEALKVVTDTLIEWLPRIRGQRDVEELSRAYVAEQIAMAQAAIAKAEGREP